MGESVFKLSSAKTSIRSGSLQNHFLFTVVGGEFCLVNEIEVSEDKEALIGLAGTVAGGSTTFVASLPIPLEVKAPATALATTVTGAILL